MLDNYNLRIDSFVDSIGVLVADKVNKQVAMSWGYAIEANKIAICASILIDGKVNRCLEKVDLAFLNQLCPASYYDVDLTSEAINDIAEQFVYAYNNPVKSRPMAIKKSPVKRTFIGFSCPNCGATLDLNENKDLVCSHCGQIFYGD